MCNSGWTLLTILGLFGEAVGPLLLRETFVSVQIAEAAKGTGASLGLDDTLHETLQFPELVLVQDVVGVFVQHGELPFQQPLFRGTGRVLGLSQVFVVEHFQEIRVELLLVRG